MQNYSFEFKFIIVGDAAVGKSCFVQQFLNQQLRQSYDITIGVEFGIKKISIDQKIIKIQIWDTAGQQNFKSITRSYFRGSIGAFIMYDITRRETFKHVELWLQDIKESGNKYITFYLIGNKNDLEDRRAVSEEEGRQLAEKYKMMFVETNYREKEQTEKSFKQLASCIVQKISDQIIPIDLQNIGVKLGDGLDKMTLNKLGKQPGKRSCC